MVGQFNRKLQNLLESWPAGVIMTSKRLEELGISRQLANEYKKSKWITSFANGAFYKPQDKIEWSGALHALQYQLGLNIHLGGKAALEIQGLGHNIPIGHQTIELLIAPKTQIPRWFKQYPWEEQLRITENNAFPSNMEIQEIHFNQFNIRASSRERAALEMLILTPRLYNFEETRILMESLGTLRADVLTKLLSKCTSEKAKRLILYFGNQFNHAWRSKLDEKKIKIGKSLLKISSEKGKYIAKYNLFLPNEYVIQNENSPQF